MNENIVWHQAQISRESRQHQNKHKSFILWFTGLSGAGKSTLAHCVEELLHERSCKTYVLDGDNVRHGLCRDLGFTAHDRQENIRRIGEVSKLLVDAGVITLTAFISPFREDRDKVRKLVADGDFLEIFCDAPLDVCEGRDVKGLYRKARTGELSDFTGISSPYEAPLQPELTVHTGREGVDICARQVVDYLQKRNYITTI